MASLSCISLERPPVPTRERRNGRIAALLATTTLVAVAALLPDVARAQTVWTDTTGDWFTAANWSAGVPNGGTAATVSNGGTAQINGAAIASNLIIGGNSTVDLQSGTLTTLPCFSTRPERFP